jgi:hypothetical protein
MAHNAPSPVALRTKTALSSASDGPSQLCSPSFQRGEYRVRQPPLIAGIDRVRVN